ncbi:MAG TPA: putative Ig domain-containing protein [Acidimicrobiales bacterium]|nr:putative Ig domain-containing protein [Acidimicrobiales bacterium]
MAGSGFATVLAGSPAAATAPRQWSLQASDANGGIRTFSSVSCPTVSRCEAIGGLDNENTIGGLILSSDDGGATWSVQYSVAPRQQLIGITCSTVSDCIAVGGYTLLTTTDGGATWTPRSIPGQEILKTVTCSSPLDCVAGGEALISGPGGSYPLLATTDGGVTWTGAFVNSDDGMFSGIACPTSSDCVAVGMENLHGLGAAAVSGDGGFTWTDVGLPSATPWLQAVSCPTPSDCVAVGYGNTAATVMTSSDGGLDWAPVPIPTGVRYLQGLSCSDSSHCVAVGATAAPAGVVLTTDDGGTTWTESALPSSVPQLDAVSCDGVHCAAGGFPLATSLVSGDGGATWTATPFDQGVATPAGITCPSVLDCVLAPDLERITPGAITPSSNQGAVNAVSCATSTDCLGIGIDADVTTDGGATWTDKSTAPLTAGLGAVSCATTSACIAVGTVGGPNGNEAVISATTDRGTTWSPQTAPTELTGLGSISCATASHCVAVGFAPNAITGDGAGAIETTDGGARWTERSVPGMQRAFQVACPTTSTCVAAGLTDAGWGGVSVSDDGGATWTTQTFLWVRQLDSVSCPTPSDCVAVGGSQGMGTNDGGTTWTAEALPSDIAGLDSVSCPTPSLCMATGQGPRGGMALIGTGAVGPSQPAITSAASLTVETGTSFSFTVTTTGTVVPSDPRTTNESTAPWLTASDIDVGGVSFVDNGDGTATISGIPASGGVLVFTVAVSDGPGNAAYQQFSLTVDEPPSFTQNLGGDLLPGMSLDWIYSPAAYPAPTITESGALPAGITFADDGGGTFTIAGTVLPGSEGTYPVTLTATNAVGVATMSFTLEVWWPTTITSGASASATAGVPLSFTVTATGQGPVALSETGPLPAGVTFTDNGNATATLAGTPAASVSGTYPLTITNHTDYGSVTQAFTLTVTGILTVDQSSLPPAVIGTPYDHQLVVSGGASPYRWTLQSGTLPLHFRLRPDGRLTGTPRKTTSPGPYTFTVGVSDSTARTSGGPATAVATVTLVVDS